MIIHIASDEKFINSAYFQFNSLYGVENHFYILVDDVHAKLQFVKLHENIQLIKISISGLKKLGKSLTDCSLVCFHGLDYYRSIVLNNIPQGQKIIWFLFGMELYNNPRLFEIRELTGKWTFEEFISKDFFKSIKSIIKDLLRNGVYRIKNNSSSPFREITKAMKRATSLGVLYNEEYELVKSKLATGIQFIKFTYYPIEQMLTNSESFIKGSNILLGNSASYTNNHLEAFELLSHLNLSNRKVITPLSYGNTDYKVRIENEGQRILKDNFEPLVDFIPLHDYNNIIQSCSIVIMNHYRQQAVGNVLVMLWMGAKVYLDNRNSLFHYLKRINVLVFEVSKDLCSSNSNVLDPLTKEEQMHNRNCLKNEITEEVLLEELKQALKLIL